MTIGGSIFLIVVGAILYFAMETSWLGIDLDIAGVILMAAGALGLLLSMFFRRSRRGTYVEGHTHEPTL